MRNRYSLYLPLCNKSVWIIDISLNEVSTLQNTTTPLCKFVLSYNQLRPMFCK